MGAAYFYLLTENTVEQTLPSLIGRAQGQGWQIELRGVDAGRMDKLDQALWLGPDDGFLAHGLAGGAHDALQPVLLTLSPTDRPCVMCVDGAEVTADQVQAAQRVCILFDGNDAQALAGARVQWKSLTGAGCAAQYWAQDNGRWVMKAEAGQNSPPASS
jgi:DNA polymerase III subunit chi